MLERVPERSGHGVVDDDVGRLADAGQQHHGLAQVSVDLVVEVLVPGVGEDERGMRHLHQDLHDDDDDQHGCGLGLGAAARLRGGHAEAPPDGGDDGLGEQSCEHRHGDVRDEPVEQPHHDEQRAGQGRVGRGFE